MNTLMKNLYRVGCILCIFLIPYVSGVVAVMLAFVYVAMGWLHESSTIDEFMENKIILDLPDDVSVKKYNSVS